MQKPKKYDWKDSNMELFGSKEDRSVKKAAAETENAWKAAKACNQPNLFVWRIEKFKVVPWPKDSYGSFYSGDSYIILNIFKEPGSDELNYDVHFWIGKYSTQDEYGTAAYKTVELDTLLDDKPVQHREVQGNESDLFKSYFPSMTLMKGGCDSGFRHVETKEYKPRLLHISGEKRRIVVKEVKTSRNVLDEGDVFILDMGDKIYQWNGRSANKDEKFKAASYTNDLVSKRHGKSKLEVIDDADTSKSHVFYQSLTDEDTKKSFKKEKSKSTIPKKLFKLSDSSGKMEYNKVAESDFSKNDLDESDVFIIDNGEVVYVYVGEGASDAERSNALSYAHKYLQETEYPLIPVSVVNNKTKGVTGNNFQAVLAA